MIFEEPSSWWYSNKEIPQVSNVLKDVLYSSHIQLSLDEAKEDIVEEGLV